MIADSTAPTLTVKGTTQIVGIFGDPLVYTLSPQMHNSAFRQLDLDFVYVPFVVKPQHLKTAVESLRALNVRGVNVTIPHKQTILPLMDEVSPLASTIGAVNTVLNQRGKLIGHNTDATGFLTSLKEDGHFNPHGKIALILGAGGTAHAMCIALLESGIKQIIIMNRTIARAQELISHLKQLAPQATLSAQELNRENFTASIRVSDLLLNATPTGIDSDSLGISLEKLLTSSHFIFDAVYARTTPLLTAAQRAGAGYLNGLGMLVRQGALSFSMWTGAEPPVEIMRQSLEKS